MRVHTHTIFQLDISDDDALLFTTLHDDSYEYSGDVALAGDLFGGDDDDNEVSYSDEEKAIMKQTLLGMQLSSELFQQYQLPLDLLNLQANMDLMPDIKNYISAQIGDATTDLGLNRQIKNESAAAALANIRHQQDQIKADTAQSQRMYDAANKLVDYSMSSAKDLYANSMGKADDIYSTGMGLMNDVYSKGIEAAADTKATAKDLYANYGDLNARFLAELDKYNEQSDKLSREKLDMLTADYGGVMGLANADVTQSYKNAKDALEREQARYGYSPTSGVANEQDRLLALSQARDTALARQQARFGEENRVETGNLERTKLNWNKDLDLLSKNTANNTALGALTSSTLEGANSLLANSNNTLLGAGSTAGSILGATGNATSNLIGNAASSSNFLSNAAQAGNLVNAAPITAKDYTSMINGNWGVNTGQPQYNLPGGTDFANLMLGSTNAANSNNLGVQNQSSGSMWPALIGAGSTLGAAWLMS